MIAPAVGLGLLVVFIAGGGIVYTVLTFIEPRWWSNLAEKGKDRIAMIGGGLSVVLLVLFMADVPRWMPTIWIVLTAIGILFGLSTFVLNKPKGRAQKWAEPRPVVSARVRSVPECPSTPDRSTKILPPAREDYHRKLLIKAWHDKGLADRLVEYERQRNPSASFDELCKTAIERWERDNR